MRVRWIAAAALAALALAPAAEAKDPGRWFLRDVRHMPIEYFQGVASNSRPSLFFDGVFSGLYRTDSRLREQARNANEIPAAVGASEGYNHIGDITWDGPPSGDPGRILLPLECYTPGKPNGGNTCGTGAIGVADPTTLAWLYYVKLDPAEIPKAMWCEVSPDRKYLWTSSGKDLLAYNLSDISPANAAPGAPPIHAAIRLKGAVPPSGITGAAFPQGDRLFLAGQTGGFQVWSVDLKTGARRLEIERDIVGESEGLGHWTLAQDLGARTDDLYWIITPTTFGGRPPTYGAGRSALLHFVARGRATRVQALPRTVKAGRVKVNFQVTTVIDGVRTAVSGVQVAFAGKVRKTGAEGIAPFRLTIERPGVRTAIAKRPGIATARTTVTIRAAG
jgi:hypothetical protein